MLLPGQARRPGTSPFGQGGGGAVSALGVRRLCSSSARTPRWVILAESPPLEPPFSLSDGCLHFLPLPCDTAETELVTV